MDDSQGGVLWCLGVHGVGSGFGWVGGTIPWAGDHGLYSEESELGASMPCPLLLIMVTVMSPVLSKLCCCDIPIMRDLLWSGIVSQINP